MNACSHDAAKVLGDKNSNYLSGRWKAYLAETNQTDQIDISKNISIIREYKKSVITRS